VAYLAASSSSFALRQKIHLSGPALSRRKKIRGISKIRLCQKYFHICTFLEAFCVFVRDIAFGVSYGWVLSRSGPKAL